jgi:hypothetical protein
MRCMLKPLNTSESPAAHLMLDSLCGLIGSSRQTMHYSKPMLLSLTLSTFQAMLVSFN